jgi:hypothetical protein
MMTIFPDSDVPKLITWPIATAQIERANEQEKWERWEKFNQQPLMESDLVATGLHTGSYNNISSCHACHDLA